MSTYTAVAGSVMSGICDQMFQAAPDDNIVIGLYCTQSTLCVIDSSSEILNVIGLFILTTRVMDVFSMK